MNASPKMNRAIADMAAGGLLYVVVESEHQQPDWPKPGCGYVVHDGPPMRIGQRTVRKIERFGTRWDSSVKAVVLTDIGRMRARGRDVLDLAEARS
jgi:hypothetical protein